MSRNIISSPQDVKRALELLYEDAIRRLQTNPTSICPVNMVSSFVKLCQAQSCGKCVPCRVGLQNLVSMIDTVLDGGAKISSLRLIEQTARVISDTADCAVGYEAADAVLRSLDAFRYDYESHILKEKCLARFTEAVPCTANCPAGVDVPGYLTLVGERRYDDAIRLIRRDNPFPAACGYVCEHPCETRCRRGLLDDVINIRGIKRFAADNAGPVAPPACLPATGRSVAVIGGGPAGLSCAYFARLFGHRVTVFEKQPHLGGMLRYGIPGFRLPAERLKYDLDAILATGVTVKLRTEIGKDISFSELRRMFDAVYIAIGAHADKKLDGPGADAKGIIPASHLLVSLGSGESPDFTGKRVIVVGGGNVAVDSARAARRLGAESTVIVYRRRERDMPAYAEDIVAAVSEGVAICPLSAATAVEADGDGNVTALRVQPQIIGAIGDDGRVSARNAKLPEVTIPCDIIITAIGQDVENRHFRECVVPVEWGTLVTDENGAVPTMPGVFAGGDCASGPASVIHAVAAGKSAAGNIDVYLGYTRRPKVDIGVSFSPLYEKPRIARSEIQGRASDRCGCNLGAAGEGLTREEVSQEAMRCLRCDHFGFGTLGEV